MTRVVVYHGGQSDWQIAGLHNAMSKYIGDSHLNADTTIHGIGAADRPQK
jgi:hypothetical protein